MPRTKDIDAQEGRTLESTTLSGFGDDDDTDIHSHTAASGSWHHVILYVAYDLSTDSGGVNTARVRYRKNGVTGWTTIEQVSGGSDSISDITVDMGALDALEDFQLETDAHAEPLSPGNRSEAVITAWELRLVPRRRTVT